VQGLAKNRDDFSGAVSRPMISLPVCRWRDTQGADRHLCRSPKFLQAPNLVIADTCRECGYADHEPPAPSPRALPCVHLGEWTGKRVRPRAGAAACDLFACALHGRCAADSTRRMLPGKVRTCTHCADYLPRDPFGPNSAQMQGRAEAFLAAIAQYPAKRYAGRGIVIAGGGERYFASLYVTVRALRHVGCRLPIQVWYLGRNKEMPRARQALLAPWDVECVDADRVRRRHPARRLDGWELKVFATMHCPFAEVLFLDADCYPCRNPEFLFELAEYRARGAIFWPDCAPFDDRLKWPAFGVPDPRRPGSVESGQFLVNKQVCWRALNLAWFYNDHSDYYYCYCYGDKHTFEVAWTHLGQPFVMFTPNAVVDHVGYLQGGPDGDSLFIHRCADKFRVDVQPYVTPQSNVMPGFYPGVPMERECWGWLQELARVLGMPVRSPEGAVLEPVSTPASRVTLTTLYTPEIAAYGARTTAVLCQYAARHGYRTLTQATRLDTNRPPSWSKILLINQAFAADPPCEWAMWVDADALILRHEIPLTEFLDDSADLIVGEDSPYSLLNMGVFFVRNCPAVAMLFRRAYAKTEYIDHPWWEQAAVIEAIREGVPGLRVKIVPRRLFNGHPDEFREGDFAIHFAGRSHAERVLELGRLAARLLRNKSRRHAEL
jgi:hypothetical protein